MLKCKCNGQGTEDVELTADGEERYSKEGCVLASAARDVAGNRWMQALPSGYSGIYLGILDIGRSKVDLLWLKL